MQQNLVGLFCFET